MPPSKSSVIKDQLYLLWVAVIIFKAKSRRTNVRKDKNIWGFSTQTTSPCPSETKKLTLPKADESCVQLGYLFVRPVKTCELKQYSMYRHWS
ncbi:hypothetical protein FKM82_011296 [Ascaphus truei]